MTFEPEQEGQMSDALPARVRLSRGEWAVIFLLVISVIINYADRIDLSLAMPLIQHSFTLTPLQEGRLLSAFFWSYALLQLFGVAGWISDRFPVGWVMIGGYLLWSGATLAVGAVSSFSMLFALRLLLGSGESVAYPCYSRVFVELPQQHRGRANALVDIGTKLGPAIGAFVGGLLLVHFGWRMLFVVLGAGGLLWLLPWFGVMKFGVLPRSGRHVAAEGSTPSPAFTELLRTKSAWGTYIGHFCGNYFFYFLLAWLPNYLVHEENLSIRSMSRVTSAVFLLIASSTLVTGWVSDRLIAAGSSPTRVRRSVVVGGLAVASCLLLLFFVHRSMTISNVLLAVACVGYGAYASNHWAISQTLAGPAMAGRWTSLQNGCSNLSGIVAPWVAGWIVQVNGSSRLAFVIAGAVALAGACLFALLVRRVEPVLWSAASGGQQPMKRSS
jgi:MFS family permease